ncbi:MAG: sodium:solute symporter family transporter [Planctomycetota bacterium]|jgi:SSS family solute:Na+ symporter
MDVVSLIAQSGMTKVDTVIVFVYLIGIMVIGILAGYRKGASSEQFFLAGKSLKWPMIGAALFTANISTIHLIGLSAAGYSQGLVVGNFEWMASFCLILLGLIFVPFYLRTKINTLPEFLERRYNKTCRMILALVAIWSALLVHIGVSLYAGAKVFDYFFGIEPILAIIIIATITAIYTILGGLKAVVVTDTIQVVLLLGGCILITIFGLSKLSAQGIDSFAAFKAAAKPDQLNMAQSLRDANGNYSEYSWLTVMIGYHVLGIWYWCTDQTIVQKALGARDMRHGQLGAVFAGVLKILPLFFMVLPGVIAYILFRDTITDPNDSLVVMIDNLLPIGLKGLFAAGLLAAVMSTVEAALNSTATVTAEDLCQHIWPNLKDKTLVVIGRITAVIVIILAMIWSPLCDRFANIFEVINKVPMMFAPAVTTVFVFGVFWRRGTKQAAVATFIAGLIVGLPYFIIDMPHNVPAAEIKHAIEAKRVGVDRIVEKWYAGPAEELQAVIDSSGVSSDKIAKTWESLPGAIKNKAKEVTEVAKDESVQGWVAVPVRYLAEPGQQVKLPSDKTYELYASVPKMEVEAALTAGAMPASWMVLNYMKIAHGKGIPFMLMGLILISMCIVIYVVVSLITPAPTAEELESMGWRPPLKVLVEKKISGITDPRVVAIGLFALMALLYIINIVMSK